MTQYKGEKERKGDLSERKKDIVGHKEIEERNYQSLCDVLCEAVVTQRRV